LFVAADRETLIAHRAAADIVLDWNGLTIATGLHNMTRKIVIDINMKKNKPSVFKFKRIAHSARLRQILLSFIAANL